MGRHLLLVALLGESALALLALGWMALRGLPLVWGPMGNAVVAGGLTAVVCAAVNVAILRAAPPFRPVESIRRVYRQLLEPLFGTLSGPEIVTLSLAASVGEELLFRGALQRELGVVPAALAFGALHWGGGGTLAFATGAALLGAVLGWLMVATGGLLAPMVAHAVYDALVLAYIRQEAQGHRAMKEQRAMPMPNQRSDA
jgi:membrane protease YdiL (CAAX protease family)